MPDVFTKAKRSEVMSRIRGRGNKDTELALIRVFRAHDITGWRRHVVVKVAGRSTSTRPFPKGRGGGVFRVRPDFVFPKLHVVVFVDGCFWHGCPQHSNMPANNRAFWKRKLEGNAERDRQVTRTLHKAGWRVVRIWEHELARRNAGRLLRRIRYALAPRDGYDRPPG